jgi:hypothetical protein
MSLSLLPIKAANTLFMTVCHLARPILSKIYNQQLLTLCWHLFSIWGREGIAISLAHKGAQSCQYDSLQPICSVITHNTWPIIIDTLLMLILKLGQGRYCHLFCLLRWPMIPLWLPTTYRWCDYPECMTNNCWCFVDTHLAMGVSTICNDLIWCNPSLTLFWQHFKHFHFLSSWSLHCSLIIHINI